MNGLISAFQAIKAISAFIVVVLPLQAVASDAYPVTKSDRKFLAELVKAVERNDVSWIAKHSSYPLSAGKPTGKPRRPIKSEKEFTALLRDKLTKRVRTKILSDAQQPLFKNWQGVMIGDGIVWFSEFEDEQRHQPKYFILAFGGFAWQPEDWRISDGN